MIIFKIYIYIYILFVVHVKLRHHPYVGQTIMTRAALLWKVRDSFLQDRTQQRVKNNSNKKKKKKKKSKNRGGNIDNERKQRNET